MFKPDYLCDNEICKDVLNEKLYQIKALSEENVELIKERDEAKRLLQDLHLNCENDYVLTKIEEHLKKG